MRGSQTTGVDERLAVFARFPEPGRAKTRLIPALGPEGAAQIHEEMVRHTLKSIDGLSARRHVSVEVWYAGGDPVRFGDTFGPREYRAQVEGDLGERMSYAFRSMLAEAHAAVIVGTDCPALDSVVLIEAFESLRSYDVVLGPASDGGYYLIGLRASVSGLFDHMPWGTDTVFVETLRRAEGLGLNVHRLRILDDVDEPSDLRVWERYRAPERGSCSEARPVLSIVIPTLNEEAHIATTIDSVRGEGIEVIVADGGSSDSTRAIASSNGARVVEGPRGRGPQLNAGAVVARSDLLLFLHADTTLPPDYLKVVKETLADPGVALGAFRLCIDRPGLLMRGIEAAVRLRCAVLAMPYGDQALFLSSRTFASLGGFADIPLMEDVDLVHRAGTIGAIRILPEVVVTSGRRWESAGVLRMTLINLSCLVGFRLGIPTSRLATWRDRRSKVLAQMSGADRNELEPMPCIDPPGSRVTAER